MFLLVPSLGNTYQDASAKVASKTEKVMFPLIGLLLTCFLVPSAVFLCWVCFLGNLLKESTVTKRLADTAKGPLIDIVTILIGLTVGASTQATSFLTVKSLVFSHWAQFRLLYHFWRCSLLVN